jgi:hypothetical protein
MVARYGIARPPTEPRPMVARYGIARPMYPRYGIAPVDLQKPTRSR